MFIWLFLENLLYLHHNNKNYWLTSKTLGGKYTQLLANNIMFNGKIIRPMNTKRREDLEKAVVLLERAGRIIERVRGAELDAYDDMTDSERSDGRAREFLSKLGALENSSAYHIRETINEIDRIIEA